MNAIFNAIDKVEESLGHSPHPPLTDIPVGAWAVSNISDVMGLLTDDHAYDDCARISMGIGLIGAAGAVLTGIRDYSLIPNDRQPNHDIATRHALGNAVVGTLFATSYFLRTRNRRAGLVSRLLGLAGGGLMLYTSWLGGKLVEELGEAVKPVMEEHGKHELERRSSNRHGGDELANLGSARHAAREVGIRAGR